MLAEMVNF